VGAFTQIPQEFDFSKERANIQYLQQFAHTPSPHPALDSPLAGAVRYPQVHEALCTSSVLVMEYVDGTPLIVDGKPGVPLAQGQQLLRALLFEYGRQVFLQV